MLNSQHLYADALHTALTNVHSWLDLGCGHQFLPEWMSADRAAAISLSAARRCTVGVDIDREALRQHPSLRLRIVGDVERLPVVAASFELVTANMVVEHVADPDRFFHEVSRVLKPGGAFLLHTPNAHGYTTRLTRCIPSAWRPRVANLLQGRQERDVYRTYYRANTLDVLQSVAARAGLKVKELKTVPSSAQLYRVPVLRAVEERVLRLLSQESWQRWQPCIIGCFER